VLTFSAAPYDEIRLLVKRLTDIAAGRRRPGGAGAVHGGDFDCDPADFARPRDFRQVRCGLNGRRFLFYKFRSMCQNAEELKPALEHLNTGRRSSRYRTIRA